MMTTTFSGSADQFFRKSTAPQTTGSDSSFNKMITPKVHSGDRQVRQAGSAGITCDSSQVNISFWIMAGGDGILG